ncbi:MAG: ABC transporter ATP-binding protein [Rhodospirillales bacterium]|nr:ABC transporter ATP-binding protein [Rhodospirillales bacterium]MDH3911069.1 ABC transporter ATP-binding protein [Rhodospirillales bacterium]MDH3916939.1 ABC transporter ATP-binding protein [Rhodospirillales bacterium]MDH3967613.1 ABC transporter ATP-binding protein [Rhodospirillales bacterium]
MLRLERLACGYGPMRVVHGLDLEVAAGEVVALVGANGAGKSTTLMAIAGHVAVQDGTIRFEGRDLATALPHQRVAAGVALVPEGRRLFADLSVRENLLIGGYARPRGRTPANQETVLALMPRLAERLEQRAGSLSGGEQQMLAIGRALMAEPRLLLVDELSLGLMPKNVDLCYEAIAELKRRGLAILLVEQNTQKAFAVADRVTVLESGRPVWAGTAAEAREHPTLIEAYLGLATATDAPP